MLFFRKKEAILWSMRTLTPNRFHAGLIVMLILLLSGTVSAQQQYRSISALRFNYYTDDRASLDYEEVFIVPLPEQFYLITAVLGNASDFEQALGGKLGLAFDLPGFYYGETTFTYERYFDDEDAPNKSTLYGSLTYETGGTRSSIGLTGEFSEETWGIIFSPGINYLVKPSWELYLKYFSAYNQYDDDQFFNHAVWAGTEYEIQPTVWLHLGGTFGTVYEPDTSSEKWSAIAGLKVLPVKDLTVRYQFEYTTEQYYEIISNGIVVDYKF
jgi:hypothetical protein